jgi:predicted ATP-grasp superfamily ATP-dependent carboligase
VDALVADAHLRNAVAGLRGLGRAGIAAVALGNGRLAAGRWSRWAAAREAGDLADVATRRGPIVVYPGQETTIDALLALRPRLAGGVVLPWPGAGPVRAVRDKRALAALAEGHGLRPPETLFDGTAAALASARIPLPAVVKPAAAGGALPTARAIDSPRALEALVAALPPDEPVLAQERVDGTLVSLALVLGRDGAVAALFQEEVARTWPRSAGSFAATVSAAPDRDLAERAAAMLAGAGYWGLAQLDLSRRGDETLLLDVNTRYYACMPLALACGVNLPATWHAVVDGRPAGSPTAYPAGRTFRWLEGDLYAARHGHPAALVRPHRPAHAGAIWASDDPLASLLLAGDAASLPVRRRLAAVRGAR